MYCLFIVAFQANDGKQNTSFNEHIITFSFGFNKIQINCNY